MVRNREKKIVINEDLNCYLDFIDRDWLAEDLSRFADSSPYREPVETLFHTWGAISSANGIPLGILSRVQDVDKQEVWDKAIQSEATRKGLWFMQRTFFDCWCRAYMQFLQTMVEPVNDAKEFALKFTEKFGAEVCDRCWNNPEIQFHIEVGKCLSQSGGKPSGWLADVEHGIEMQDGVFHIRTQNLRYMAATLMRAAGFLIDVLAGKIERGG